jgi:hypothetical protein
MLGVSVQNFTELGGSADFSLARFRDGSDKGTSSNSVHISEKVRRTPWQQMKLLQQF